MKLPKYLNLGRSGKTFFGVETSRFAVFALVEVSWSSFGGENIK